MEIREESFKLVPNKGGYMFDLYVLKEKTKGINKGDTDWALVGYGMSIPTCIKRLCHLHLNSLDVVTLKEYLSEYNELYTKFEQLFTANRL